jgi:protoheme IX farnesyltransferase
VVTVLPYLTGMSGLIYLASALVLDAIFLRHAWQLLRTSRSDLPMRTFRYSIQYLALLFSALLIDHYLLIRP